MRIFIALIFIASAAFSDSEIPANHVVEIPTRVGPVKISMSFPEHINFCFDEKGNMHAIQSSGCCPTGWNSVAPQANGCKPLPGK